MNYAEYDKSIENAENERRDAEKNAVSVEKSIAGIAMVGVAGVVAAACLGGLMALAWYAASAVVGLRLIEGAA